ncbi:MAG: hypothetical protein V3U02_11340 [Calditrichia bacterium]
MPPKGAAVTLFGPDGRQAEFDNKFKIPIVIDSEHHEIHEGDRYTVFFENDVTNIGEMTVIAFNVPAGTKRIHMVILASVTSLTQLSLYESPSIDVDEGTQKNPVNRDLNSSNESILTSIETTPVENEVTTLDETQAAGANISKATELWHEDIGQSGNPLAVAGGLSRGQTEFILENGKQYAVILEALDNNDNHCNIILEWYEHTDE